MFNLQAGCVIVQEAKAQGSRGPYALRAPLWVPVFMCKAGHGFVRQRAIISRGNQEPAGCRQNNVDRTGLAAQRTSVPRVSEEPTVSSGQAAGGTLAAAPWALGQVAPGPRPQSSANAPPLGLEAPTL